MDIRLDSMHRAVHNELNPYRCRQMKHHITPLHKNSHCGGISDSIPHKLERIIALEMGNILHTPSAQVVNDGNLVSGFQQLFSQMRTDKSGPACD
jgi:hypothetical protein